MAELPRPGERLPRNEPPPAGYVQVDCVAGVWMESVWMPDSAREEPTPDDDDGCPF